MPVSSPGLTGFIEQSQVIDDNGWGIRVIRQLLWLKGGDSVDTAKVH